jgi:hypothetical protein
LTEEEQIWLDPEELKNLLHGELRWRDLLEEREDLKAAALRVGRLAANPEQGAMKVAWLLSLMACAVLGSWVYFVFVL